MSEIHINEEEIPSQSDNEALTETLVLLHGLFGATGNFSFLSSYFSKKYKVVIPQLPILSAPLKESGLPGLVAFVDKYITKEGFDQVHLVGNSLGGHVAQLYALQFPERVKTITLTGSSGLFENSLGTGFPKRGDYEFIKSKAQSIFYDPKIATKEIVDEVYDTVNDREKAIRVVINAKSAVRNNLEDKIPQISCPTLLVWGKDDSITPLWVGKKFNELIPNSKLVVLDNCGHAPMMEKPEEFNHILDEFLANCDQPTT